MNGCSAARKGELLALAQRLGVTFHDIGLLHTALVHTSYANEAQGRVAHNERLEFLGDAVLELASSTYLYTHFPSLPEGELTKTRASIVCSAALAKIADAFEAVLGAIYLDQGWEAARDYALRQLAPEFDQVRHGENLQDYKTLLQELVQKTPGSTIAYELLEATGPDHAKHYRYAVVINGKTCGEGEGSSKKEAEQQAARMALARQKK